VYPNPTQLKHPPPHPGSLVAMRTMRWCGASGDRSWPRMSRS